MRTTAWVKYHGVKQEMLLKILDIIERHEVQIAFPTSTLYITGDDDNPYKSGAEAPPPPTTG